MANALQANASLPVYVIGNFGSSESLQDLLTQAYGNLASSITSVSIAYEDSSYLQSIKDYAGNPSPFGFWDPAYSSAADVTQVSEGPFIIGESSDPSGDLNYLKVSSAHFKDVSISIGDNIMPNVFLQVQMAPNADGTVPAVQELQVGAIPETLDAQSIAQDRAAHFGQPTPDDIVNAAEYVASVENYVVNPNDCHFIAMDIAALAGATLPAMSWSTDPSKNQDGGFWRVVYRGSDSHDNPYAWQQLVQPGDIVRMVQPGGAYHTVTVTGAYNTVLNTPHSGEMRVVDNEAPDLAGTNNDAIGEHWAAFATADPKTITIYRLSPDHLYLIDGSGSSDNQTLVGNQFNDLIKAGSGNDRLYGGSGSDVLVGGTGNDWFDPGAGVNTMTAGSGKNIFHFGNDGNHYDTINNFQVGRDTLDLGDVSGLTGSGQLLIADTERGAYIGYGALNIILPGLTADQIKAHPEMFRFAGMPEIPFNLQLNQPPVVTAHDVTVHAGASVALSSLFTANDPDGDGITQYMFMDDGSHGHFEKDGVVLASHTWQYVDAADLGKINYVADNAGNNPLYVAASGSDPLYVAAYDGKDWSANASLTATILNQPPVVSAHDVTVHAGAPVALSSLFTASDPDGDRITQYMFMDDGSDGHFEKDGVVLASHTWQHVDAADLGKINYVGGSAAGSDKLYIAAFDGHDWSANASLTATISAPGQFMYHDGMTIHADPGFNYLIADATTNTTGIHFTVAGSNITCVEGNGGNDVVDARGVNYDVTFAGFGGNDTFFGGNGNDVFYGGTLTANGWVGSGHDRLVEGGKSTNYTIAQYGGDGNSWTITDKTTHAVDVIYNVDRVQFTDKTIDTSTLDRSIWLTGGSGTLTGVAGNDHLSASNGTYTFLGGAGKDTFDFTGMGSAKFTGGAGADVFDYHAGSGHITVTDFQAGVDHISLGSTPVASLQFKDSAAGMVISTPGNGDMLLSGVHHIDAHRDFIV